MRLLRHLSVAAAIITMLIPAATSAHFDSEMENKVNAQVHNEEHGENRGLYLGHFMKMFTKGTVSSVSATGFTIKAKDDTTLAVNTASAKLVRLPRTTIALTDIKAGDRVWVQGTRSGDTITSTVVYDLSADVKPAMKKGEVTAVNGNTVTLQTKDGNTATVTTDSNTEVKKDGQAGTTSDITVGSKVHVVGLWNKITNLFTAVLIKLK